MESPKPLPVISRPLPSVVRKNLSNTRSRFFSAMPMNILNEKLRNGANIDWLPFWNEFRARAGKIEGFDDYIPPYKNLGAIFIKAYNRSMGEEI